MNLALWIVQGFLAFAFIGIGGMKVFAYEKYKVMTRRTDPAASPTALQPLSESLRSPEASASSCPRLPTLLPGSVCGRQSALDDHAARDRLPHSPT